MEAGFRSSRPSHSGGFLGRHGESSCRHEKWPSLGAVCSTATPRFCIASSRKERWICFSIPSIFTGRKGVSDGEATERDKAYNASQDLWN